MDDPNTQDDELNKDINQDDITTPADNKNVEPKTADDVKEEQKVAWLKKIESGEKTLDDMPVNLGWLKKDIEKDLKQPEKTTDRKAEIRTAIAEERAEEEFSLLVEDMQSSDITSEQDASLREEYESLLSDYQKPTPVQQLKALKIARRLVGLKDNSETIRERRIKGMALPPLGGQKRSTVEKDEMTAIEKELSVDLPPGYKV